MKERVKKLRKSLGLTMEKFGEKLGVNKTTISRIENGVNSLTEQMLKAICNVNWDGKQVNEDWLRGNSDEMFKKESGEELQALAEKYKMSDIEYAFIKEYFRLEPSRRESFFETLDVIFSAVHKNSSSVSDSKENLPEAGKNVKTTHKTTVDLNELPDEKLGKLARQGLELEERAAEKSEVS